MTTIQDTSLRADFRERAKANGVPIAHLIGFKAEEIGEGRAVVTLAAGPKHANPMGTLHGGILCDIADSRTVVTPSSTLIPNCPQLGGYCLWPPGSKVLVLNRKREGQGVHVARRVCALSIQRLEGSRPAADAALWKLNGAKGRHRGASGLCGGGQQMTRRARKRAIAEKCCEESV